MRFDVYLVRLDPVEGTEISKTRPCVVISPNLMQERYARCIIAPMTSKPFASPYRVSVFYDGVAGFAALDQIRTVSNKRLLRHLGKLNLKEGHSILKNLQAMFAA